MNNHLLSGSFRFKVNVNFLSNIYSFFLKRQNIKLDYVRVHSETLVQKGLMQKWARENFWPSWSLKNTLFLVNWSLHGLLWGKHFFHGKQGDFFANLFISPPPIYKCLANVNYETTPIFNYYKNKQTCFVCPCLNVCFQFAQTFKMVDGKIQYKISKAFIR